LKLLQGTPKRVPQNRNRKAPSPPPRPSRE
jgi:hypothetical protein